MKLLVLAIGMAACGAAQQPPPPVVHSAPPPVDAAVDASPGAIALALDGLTELTEAMCRCTEAACANQLAEEMNVRGLGMAPEGGPALSDTESQRLAELTERLTRCMTDAMTRHTVSP